MSSRSEEVRRTGRPADRSSETPPGMPESRRGSRATGHDSTSSVDPRSEQRHGRSNNKTGSLGVRRLSHLVNERDLAILGSVRAHRLIHTRQVYELHFWNHASYVSGIRACTRVLNRLEAHRFIRRLSRPVGGHGGGSSSTIWALDVAGDRLLRHFSGEKGRSRSFEPSLAFQTHTLAIADLRVALERAAREGAFELLTVQTEPDTWRTYPGQLGAERTIKPDLHVVTASSEFEDHWFIELDLGTESVGTLRSKLDAYTAYRASGREQRAGGVFPRVVWLVPDTRRLATLTELAAMHDARLFFVTTADRLLAMFGYDDQPALPDPNGDEKQ